MSIDVRMLSHVEIARQLSDVATLRITVFRDWPYLYDGEAEYEQRYMRPYVESSRAVVAGAFEGLALVDAATGTPLSDHEPGVAETVRGLGLAQDQVFYLAESVLLPAFRGRGIGHAFFDHRERHARRHEFRYAAFASVIRPKDHPAQPPMTRDLAPFWRAHGYCTGRGRDRAPFMARCRGRGGERQAPRHMAARPRRVALNVLETCTPWAHLVSARRVAGDLME